MHVLVPHVSISPPTRIELSHAKQVPCQASVLSLSYTHSPFRSRICLSCPVWTSTCSMGRCRTRGPFASASPVTLLRPGLPLPFHKTGAVLFPFFFFDRVSLCGLGWLQIYSIYPALATPVLRLQAQVSLSGKTECSFRQILM